MAMTSIEQLMKESGFSYDDLANANLGTPEEASERSLRAFVAEQAGEDAAEQGESHGLIHFTGPAVIGHSAPISAVGNALTSMQSAIDAIGAAIEGFSSLGGQIPNRVKARTELRMNASPLAGSVVIDVRPSMSREEDLYPDGPALFDLDNQGARPLADECLEDFLGILSSTGEDSDSHDKFIELLSGYGPRTSSAIREFCSSLERDSLDVDFRWVEPKKQPIKSQMSHARAKSVASVIKDADIEVEDIELTGVLVTSTMSKKDKLRIRLGDGTEKILSLGKIAAQDIAKYHPGETVKVIAEHRIGRYAGGREKDWYIGVSIKPAGEKEEDPKRQ